MRDSIQRFRLACDAPIPGDATSFMRALGPLHEMAREDRRLEIVVAPRSGGRPEYTWDWIASCDALFMQRPWMPSHAECAGLARLMGRPIWIDWDDDHLHVSRSNPAYPIYSKPEVVRATQTLVRLADIISVSTPQLMRELAGVGSGNGADPAGRIAADEKFRVVPNACHWPFVDGPRSRVVSWRGTIQHIEDVLQVIPSIQSLVQDEEFRDWEWIFFGEPPWAVHDAIPGSRLKVRPVSLPHSYMHSFGIVHPFVHIIPLCDTRFNRSKSNLAWIEATASGAVVLAPHWEEWQRPGVVHYRTPDEFGQKLRGLLRDYAGPAMHPNVDESRSFVGSHLALRDVNRMRWGIIDRMAKFASARHAPFGAAS